MADLAEIRLKAYKKLLDMSSWKEVVKKEADIETNDDAREIFVKLLNLEIEEHITRSISSAIPRALYLKMKNHMTEIPQIHIGPFTYGIDARDSGHGVSINPRFNSVDDSGARWKLELFDDKPHKNPDLVHLIAKYVDDDVFISTVLSFLMSWEYDTIKEQWIMNEPRYKGLQFTPEDVKFMSAIHVLVILYGLTTGDPDDEGYVELGIPGEGVYRLNPTKDGFLEVGFIPALGYKLAIKNDPLADELSEEILDGV